MLDLGPNLAPCDGEVRLIEDFVETAEAHRLFVELRDSLVWAEEAIVIAGRQRVVPRLVCWYGDPGAAYRYSGVDHDPLPWTPRLAELRMRIAERAACPSNSVLGNYYRSGADSIGWHADKERELGAAPRIASLSLGAPRRFVLRHNRTGDTLRLELPGGSLLLMAGALQRCWRHCVPKCTGSVEARINLSFRTIIR